MSEHTTNNNFGGQMGIGDGNEISGNNKATFSGNTLPRAPQRNERGVKSATTNNNFAGQMAIGNENKLDGSNTVEFASPASSEAAPPVINALFLLSSARGADSLRLNAEQQAIEEALRLSRHRDRIQMRSLPITTSTDLRRALLDPDWNYQIVHLSGHGTSSGFLLDDDGGRPRSVSPEALGEYFRLYRETLRCVLLNACYTLAVGQLVALGIPYVIAMSGPIYDRAAIEFSRGFYDAIGAGMDIKRAYTEGMSAVRLARLDQQFQALLLDPVNS